MNKYKKRLLGLLAIQALITIFHKYYEASRGLETSFSISNWTYWLALVFGFFVVGYVVNLSCLNCSARQVLRGWSIRDLHWPEDNCYKCGNKIE